MRKLERIWTKREEVMDRERQREEWRNKCKTEKSSPKKLVKEESKVGGLKLIWKLSGGVRWESNKYL